MRSFIGLKIFIVGVAFTIGKGFFSFAMAVIRSFNLCFIKKVVKVRPKEGHEFRANNAKYIKNNRLITFFNYFYKKLKV